MEIDFISLEHINNKLCMVIYKEDLKEIYIISNKNINKLYDLLLDIMLFSKKKIIKIKEV